MYTYPSVTINFITYTGLRWGQFPTIAYTTGAVAGAEVVTLTDSPFTTPTVSVQIESGVSTNTQIVAAINAAKNVSVGSLYAKDLVSMAITAGHESDTNTAVSPTALTGASSVPPTSSFPVRTVGSLSFTGVHADIGTTSATPSTTIFVPAVSGMYLLSFYGLATVSPSGADAAPNLYMAWTDERGLQKYFYFAGNLDMVYSDGPNNVTIPIYAKAGSPIWMYTSAGNYSGTIRWSFYFNVVQM